MPALTPGDFAPQFSIAASTNDEFALSSVAGWRVVLCFFGELSSAEALAALEALAARRSWLIGHRARVVIVTTASADRNDKLVRRCNDAGQFLLWDFEGTVHRLYGTTEWRGSVLLDENLRFLTEHHFDDGARHAEALCAAIGDLSDQGEPRRILRQAPVLIVPDVLDRNLCRRLIDCFETGAGRDSGYMMEVDGKTVGVIDHSRKRRRDVYIADEGVRATLLRMISKRIRPEIRKAFATDAMWVERFLVARYDAEDRGGFAAHRDNTTPGTMHRKFAVTINLNAEEYEGGDLCFPEYGRDAYRAATGGAVVFSCSLMHEALPVTRGRRYAFLPFLYDAAGRQQRLASAQSITWDRDTPAPDAERRDAPTEN